MLRYAAGNITAYGDNTLVYNDANRLAQISDSGGTLGQYNYDYQQRRVVKTSGGATTIYHYDQWGQVIAESDASGTMLREYAHTRPEHGRARLAIIDSATAAIYPVVPDHLGTPVMITNLAGAPVWSADQLPFGQTTPHASNTISQHLRFPGQYSDTESGLHYNWHRYYDPNTGRYLRVDPIGLKGGWNVYGYVYGNPIDYIDPEGLQRRGGRRRGSGGGNIRDTMADLQARQTMREIRKIDPNWSALRGPRPHGYTWEDVEFLREILRELENENRMESKCTTNQCRPRSRNRINDGPSAEEQLDGISRKRDRYPNEIGDITKSKENWKIRHRYRNADEVYDDYE